MHYPLDTESFPNYFLLCVGPHSYEIRGEDEAFTAEQKHHAILDLKNRTTYGFNSNNYDRPMIMYALMGATAGQLNAMSQWIIDTGARIWQIVEQYDLKTSFVFDHIDLIEPSPGVFIGLKKYGCRIHSQTIEDLPYSPEKRLEPSEMDVVREYCFNDLNLTRDLYEAVSDRIKLREQLGTKYDVELRSKSDAQIAEAVIRHELGNVRKPGRLPAGITFKYKAPDWMDFYRKDLKELLARLQREDFVLDNGGKVKLPKWLEPITIGDTTYKLGIGGLHSQEKKQSIVPLDYEMLIDADVASYYPSIILNEKLYPQHLGSRFLEVYQDLVDRRLKAKAEGDTITADGLKITINGTFGKLASKYSFLYSPDLMLAVTLTGQLALLMLIEELEQHKLPVVSANTDGVVALIPAQHYDLYEQLCEQWQEDTGFTLEYTCYRALHSRDVNNYLAVKMDGTTKGKGVFAETGLMKDPAAPIVHEAAKRYLVGKYPVEHTVRSCTDIRQFIVARNATGGAEWEGEYLGKTVRWVYVNKGSPITYVKNGNKVAGSDNAWPVMSLREKLPRFLNYDKYIAMAEKLIKEVGVND